MKNMQEICYKTIGKRGRTTIPFCMRNALGIKNNTLLRFTRNEKQVLVTPMRECETGLCELHRKADLTAAEIAELVNEISPATLRQMLPVIEKKLKSGEGSGKGEIHGSESKRLFN